MTIIRTSEWSDAHFAVNDLLNQLLNELRDQGYNPSYHISYDRAEQHLQLEDDILSKHPGIAATYTKYLAACTTRDHTVDQIQGQPKVDIGF